MELAAAAGLEVGNGIVVDETCRTGAPDIFAAGDVANHRHPVFGPIRVEHYDNALKMGAHAARSMLGGREPFDDPHWFWSDQYEHNIQYEGFAAEWDEIVLRGELRSRRFLASTEGRGGQGRGRVRPGQDVRRSGALIRAGRPVDRDLLADEDVDLRKLARTVAGPKDGDRAVVEGA